MNFRDLHEDDDHDLIVYLCSNFKISTLLPQIRHKYNPSFFHLSSYTSFCHRSAYDHVKARPHICDDFSEICKQLISSCKDLPPLLAKSQLIAHGPVDDRIQ